MFKSLQFPKAMLTEITKHLKTTHEAEKEYHEHKLKELHKQREICGVKLNKLVDMVLNGMISEELYEVKKQEITREFNSVKAEIEIYEKANDDFKEMLITAFYLASKSYELFICSKTPEKRELINFVFSNISLTGKKLGFTLRKPFDIMVNLSQCKDWLPNGFVFRTVNGNFDEDFYSKIQDGISHEERLKFIASRLNEEYTSSTKFFLKEIQITKQSEVLYT